MDETGLSVGGTLDWVPTGSRGYGSPRGADFEVLANGDILFVTSTIGGVVAQRADSSGTLIGYPTALYTVAWTDSVWMSPQKILAQPYGGYFVVFLAEQVSGSSGSWLVGRRYDSDGTQVGSEVDLGNGKTRFLENRLTVEELADGGFVVVNLDFQPDPNSGATLSTIKAQVFDQSGSPIGSQVDATPPNVRAGFRRRSVFQTVGGRLA